MLFTPNEQENYQLWSERRCAIVLGISMFVFFTGVFICSLLIQVRPSAAVQVMSSPGGIAVSIIKPLPAEKHDIKTVNNLRIINKDGSIDLLPFQPGKLPAQQTTLALNATQLDSKSVFILFEERSLWQFMWERW